ncbi:MAG TPA: hemerythrin domain-containing protein [Polyangiaceae bacterium]|nr:hemerythrin domain-containing protein [Polyangiaceae bacterium]
MELLDTLKREHETIEPVARALVAFAARVDEGADRADGERFLRFFRLYAGRFHHAREEEVLFPALVRETEVPADRGPIHALMGDHRQMAAALEELAGALLEPAGGARSSPAAIRYVSMLLQHIDAETSVLFPESEARFRRASVLELEVREPDDEERAARDGGLELAERYGSSAEIPGLVRGEGCACCASFGVVCDGVEREWSNDLEWEDMLDRVGD